MKKNKLFSAFLLSFVTSFASAQYGALGFLHNTSSNVPFVTTAKKIALPTFGGPGFIMAGIYPAATGSQVDFFFNRIRMTGVVGPNNMWVGGANRDYNIQCSSNCTPLTFLPYTHGCIGVDAVEIITGGTEKFALAGAFSGGIFFATLNGTGGVLSTRYWAAPNVVLNKPTICRSSNPNYFYICGAYNINSYVIKIDILGNIVWSKLYNNMNIQARDIIESPYNANEVVVVGRCQYNGFLAQDAFFLSLNASNGLVNSLTTYCDNLTGDEWFNKIEVAASPNGGNGFVVGGHMKSPTNMLYNGYTPWMLKLDPNGNVIWSTLINHNSEITDLRERYNPNTVPPSYEYFGVARENPSGNNNGLIVWKLDDFGGSSFTPNTFQYGLGTNIAGLNDLSWPQLEFDGDGGNLYDGMITVGTNVSTNRNHLSKAYFNGVNGCENTTDFVPLAGPGISANPLLTSVNFIQPCIYFLLTQVNNSASHNSICGWNSSVIGGSNARPANTTALESDASSLGLISVNPNPTSGLLNIDLRSNTESVDIKLTNSLGQLIRNFSFSEEEVAQGKVSINFENLTLKDGIYFIDVKQGKYSQSGKVVYQK